MGVIRLRRCALATILLILCGIAVGPSSAQTPLPFADALSVFEDGRYDEAATRFEQALPDLTGGWIEVASVMRAKSLYRARRPAEAWEAYRDFLRTYPNSRFFGDVRRTISFIETDLATQNERPMALGVTLSLSGAEVAQSQELFNGVRMAVDEHNLTAVGNRRIRILFRDIGSDPTGARLAVDSLADAGVRVIVGGLFSDQAREAAAAAERRSVVLVAPLATDDRVSNGRRFVFQANPTLEVRGRQMARFAVNGLLIRQFGVVSGVDPQGISERMADAFEAAADQLGADILYRVHLEKTADWFRFGSVLSADTLAMPRGLYVPIPGGSSERIADAVLSALERAGSGARLLGNGEWHALPVVGQASKFGVTSPSDFFVDPDRPATSRFIRTYATRFGGTPGRLAHAGYDVTRYLLGATDNLDDARRAADALRAAPQYEGTGVRIDFRGSQVNQAMFYHRYRDGREELIR